MATRYKVRILESAEQELKQIYLYIRDYDSADNARYVFTKLREGIKKLSTMPQRGVYPPELYELGITTHRQVHFKPYRIIYTVDEKTHHVFIEMIIDGRRNVQPILLSHIDKSH